MSSAEVVSFNRYQKEKKEGSASVYNQIERFLVIKGRASKHTRDAYESDIKYFFKFTRGKELNELLPNDLFFTINDIEDFQTHLLEDNRLSVATVNRYIVSIRECFKHLYSRNLINGLDFLSVSNMKIQSDSYDSLTTEEVDQAVKFVSSTGRERTAKIKALLIKFAVVTLFRRSECLGMTWDDFQVKDDQILAHAIVKGGETIHREIPIELYEELLTVKADGVDKVFDIGLSTIRRMMKDIRKGLQINPNRNIVFHSFRKAGAQYIYETTGDINEVRKALNHESVTTTEIYLQLDRDFGIVGYYEGQETNSNLYKEVSAEVLRQAIESLGKNHRMVINAAVDKAQKEEYSV